MITNSTQPFHPTISCPGHWSPDKTATMFTNSLEVKLLPMPIHQTKAVIPGGFSASVAETNRQQIGGQLVNDDIANDRF